MLTTNSDVKLKANQTPVEIDALRGKGQFYYPFMFVNGAEYKFPDEPRCVEEKFGKNRNFVAVKILSFKNPDAGNEPVWIPLSIFSMTPDASVEEQERFIKTYSVNAELCLCEDYAARVELIEKYTKEGKRLRIQEFVTMKRRQWKDGKSVTDEKGLPVLVDQNFPILEWVK